MTIDAGSKPFLMFPHVKHICGDWDFAAGAVGTGSDRWATSGTAPVTFVTGEGAQSGSYCARFNTAAATCYLTQQAAATPTWFVASTAFTPTVRARIKCKSKGTSAFTVRANYDGSDHDYAFAAGEIAADNTWRVVSATLTGLSASFSTCRLSIGNFTAADTNDIYVDWVAFGYEVDFGQLTGAGQSQGVGFNSPYKIVKNKCTDYERTQYGAHWGREYNGGYYSGETETNGFSNASSATWANWFDYCVRGVPFSLFYNRFSFTTNAYKKLLIDQDHDGLEQIEGTPNWKAKLAWAEALT